MWKDSIRKIVVIFQTTILRIAGFYVRRSAHDVSFFKQNCPKQKKLSGIQVQKFQSTCGVHQVETSNTAMRGSPVFKLGLTYEVKNTRCTILLAIVGEEVASTIKTEQEIQGVPR